MVDLQVIFPGVAVGCFFTVVVGVVLMTVLLLCGWRRANQPAESNGFEGGTSHITHGSSTIRSDGSEHPYEDPTLLRSKTSKQQPQVYADLQRHSLPHHYQGLGEHPLVLTRVDEESPYDELMTSTASNDGGYYFQLDPNMNADSLKSNSQSNANGGKTASPYEQVVIGNYSNNANESDGNDCIADDSSPEYFILGSTINSSEGGTARRDQESDSRKQILGEGEKRQTVAEAKPPIAAKPNLAATNTGAMAKSSSYDRLDRAVLHEPKTDDIDTSDYNKLIPVLAGQLNTAPSVESLDYMKVRGKKGSADEVVIDDEFSVESDYNKLDRGVLEREIDNLKEVEDGQHTNIHRHSIASNSSEIPVEL